MLCQLHIHAIHFTCVTSLMSWFFPWMLRSMLVRRLLHTLDYSSVGACLWSIPRCFHSVRLTTHSTTELSGLDLVSWRTVGNVDLEWTWNIQTAALKHAGTYCNSTFLSNHHNVVHLCSRSFSMPWPSWSRLSAWFSVVTWGKLNLQECHGRLWWDVKDAVLICWRVGVSHLRGVVWF